VLGHKCFLYETRVQRSNGEVIWTRRDASLLTDHMPGFGYVHTIEDISAYKAHDALTCLCNRDAFYKRFEQFQALARRHEKQMGLLLIGLDNLKGINDVLGHDSGDRILVELAHKLKTGVRTTDTVCRYGGDEFVVLLGEIAQPDHAFSVADKLRENAAAPMVIGGYDVAYHLSIGVSVYPDNGETADELLKKADAAMYRVKEMNENPVAVRPVSDYTSRQ